MSTPIGEVAPAWWCDRSFTFPEISVQTAAPSDSLYGWHRLARAMGYDFGKKTLGTWAFSPHELWTFHLMAALYRLGVPVSTALLRVLLDYAADHKDAPPEKAWIAKEAEAAGAIMLASPRLWRMTVLQCQSVIEADADENS